MQILLKMDSLGWKNIFNFKLSAAAWYFRIQNCANVKPWWSDSRKLQVLSRWEGSQQKLQNRAQGLLPHSVAYQKHDQKVSCHNQTRSNTRISFKCMFSKRVWCPLQYKFFHMVCNKPRYMYITSLHARQRKGNHSRSRLFLLSYIFF